MGPLDAVVVIPALAESAFIFRTLASLATNPDRELARTVILCVINNGEDAPAEDVEDNRSTMDTLRSLSDGYMPVRGEYLKGEASRFEAILKSGMKPAFLDASSPGKSFPAGRSGVGMARRIGCDWALALLDECRESRGNEGLILSLDADTLVDENYLSDTQAWFQNHSDIAAVVSYAHQASETDHINDAICWYETFLRYYVLGLGYAGSPYAFHSIGSTMVSTARGYAAVRGMSMRASGEDFYFLDKLAKVGNVGIIYGTTVHPSPRMSVRTPFGTGMAVDRIRNDNGGPVYHPQSFEILKRWLQVVEERTDEGAGRLLRDAATIHPLLDEFLRRYGFPLYWEKWERNSTGRHIMAAHFRRWFDGLKTFRLVRRLSKEAFPPVDLYAGLRGLITMMEEEGPPELAAEGGPDIRERHAVMEYLRRHEKHTCGTWRKTPVAG